MFNIIYIILNMNISYIIKDLDIKIGNKKILSNVDLKLKNNDVVALIGPNGVGKTTLLKALVNHYAINISKGDIFLNNKSTKNLDTYKIARMGVYYIDQIPIELEGVPMMELYKNIIRIKYSNNDFLKDYEIINGLFEKFALDKSLLYRGVNSGFSGGQKKKNEIIQSQLLDSKILLLDEVDAGLDIDALKLIEQFILKTRKDHITIVISHDLDWFYKIKPNKVILLANNKIEKIGGIEIIDEVKKDGYKKYENKQAKAIDPFKF